uniref:Uncharacterized protein n=1 Tax=Anguilla anguilla TaxID=7936 RepID=A0A0E9TQJ4_ANGAN
MLEINLPEFHQASFYLPE